jgi:anti-anti-sigma factor
MFTMGVGPGASAELVVVSLRGELDLIDAPDMATALKTLAARDRWVIADLAGLEFIDAAGVTALSRGRRLARDTGAACCSPRRTESYSGSSRSSGTPTAPSLRPAWQRRSPARRSSGQGATPVRRQPFARQS